MTDFKLSLIVRGQHPPGDPAGHLKDDLDLVRKAEAVGFDGIVKGSHYSAHPFESVQQIPFLSYCTAIAPRLRIILGLVLVPLHKPLDLAEQLATLDLLSGGRLVFGAGIGYRDVEFKAFGVPRGKMGPRFEECMTAIRRLWTEDFVDMKGSHFELDHATCPIKPLQKPTPPIWVGANADAAVERAARLGDCWYIGPAVEIGTLERQMELYRRALDAAGKPFPTELPMRREVFVAKTREEAMRLCAPYLGAKYAAYHSWRQELPTDDSGIGQSFESMVGDRFLIGSPDQVAEQMLALHRRLGVNHVVMSTEWAGMPKSLAVETMEMVARELIPRVRQGL